MLQAESSGMASVLSRFTAWRWMPCAALSFAATGFVVLALLLAPRLDERGKQAGLGDSTPSTSFSGNSRYLSAAQAGIDPTDNRSAQTAAFPPSAASSERTAAFADQDPARQGSIVSRASYGMRRFSDMVKVGFTNDDGGAPPSAQPAAVPVAAPPYPPEGLEGNSAPDAGSTNVSQNTLPPATSAADLPNVDAGMAAGGSN